MTAAAKTVRRARRAAKLLLAYAADCYFDHSDVERHDQCIAAANDLRDMFNIADIDQCTCPWCSGSTPRPET